MNVISDDGALLSGGLLGRGSLGESAILLIGAGSCLLTATEVWGAVTVLKVAIEDLEGELVLNNCSLELDLMAPLLGLVMLVLVLILDLTKGDLAGVSGTAGTLLAEGGAGRGAELLLNSRVGGGGGKGFSVSELCFSIAG